jgi:hypothetical protein
VFLHQGKSGHQGNGARKAYVLDDESRGRRHAGRVRAAAPKE